MKPEQRKQRGTREHTPGPWTITGTKNPVIIGGDKQKTVVAHVQWPEDARLIAASHELLAALESIVDIVSEYGIMEIDTGDAEAAIRKARGEA